jgi:hypothetical protein
MRTWLPSIYFLAFVLVVGAMPWHRPDPRHEFMLQLLSSLRDDSLTSEASPGLHTEVDSIEHRSAAGHSNGGSGPRI